MYCTSCKCESVVYLDFLVVFHIMSYWKFGSVFIVFKAWVGQSFTRMHRVRVAQAYVWYLPISEGTPYILPIFFLENLPTKIWEFPSLSYTSPYLEFRSPYQNLFNHSPYLKKKLSLFVISNISHVWAQAFIQQNFVKASKSCLTNKKSFKLKKKKIIIMKSVKKK